MLRIGLRAHRTTRSVTARVTFNPRIVASYRLLASKPAPEDSAAAGKEGKAGDAPCEPGNAGPVLERGAESVALYEVRLREGAEAGRVAGVAVDYEDSTGAGARLDATFAMTQWAHSYDDGAPQLRLGIAAAGFAELLRAEPSSRPRPSFADLARIAWQIAADTRGDPEAVRFALLIERTDAIERALTPEQRWHWESGGLPPLPDRYEEHH
jgi:hypothetical protein